MISPLFFVSTKEGAARGIYPKLRVHDKSYKVTKFISNVSTKFESMPEKICAKEVGFLTVAGYIMLEILHKINPGFCVDQLTSFSSEKDMITLRQASILFATGIKIGQSLPEGLKIDSETGDFDLWESK